MVYVELQNDSNFTNYSYKFDLGQDLGYSKQLLVEFHYSHLNFPLASIGHKALNEKLEFARF